MEPILFILVAVVLVLVIGFVVSKAGGTNPASPSPDRPAHSPTGTEDSSEPDIPPYPTGSRPGGPGAEAMNPAEGSPSPDADTDYDTEDAVAPSEAARKPLDDG